MRIHSINWSNYVKNERDFMLIDLTLRVTPKMVKDAQGNEKKAFTGHLGTHFDVMNKEFPLEFTEREAFIFDVSQRVLDEININDVNLNEVREYMFIGFYTGFGDKFPYGSKGYFSTHPQLSNELINTLLERKVSIIGIDCAGIRRGIEHTPIDQKCADNHCFVVENLVNLKDVCNKKIIIQTFPMNFSDMSGLPCRVIAKI